MTIVNDPFTVLFYVNQMTNDKNSLLCNDSEIIHSAILKTKRDLSVSQLLEILYLSCYVLCFTAAAHKGFLLSGSCNIL